MPRWHLARFNEPLRKLPRCTAASCGCHCSSDVSPQNRHRAGCPAGRAELPSLHGFGATEEHCTGTLPPPRRDWGSLRGYSRPTRDGNSCPLTIHLQQKMSYICYGVKEKGEDVP